MIEFNTPYSAMYIGKANLTTREPQVIHFEEDRPYGIRIVTEDTIIPYSNIDSALQFWQINLE